MTDPVVSVRPAPRWFHAGAILTLGIVLFPLVLGQLVTSLRAGMADPRWPTEPWYLLNNYRFDLGYLVEHSHRIAGFTLGGVVSLLTLGLWWTDPRKAARWAGLAGIVVLLAAYGQFHRAMMDLPETGEVVIPPGPVAGMAVGLGLALVVGVSGLFAGVRGSGLRLLAVVTLVAVMIQGLLGGTRVLYNALSGPELAAIHGMFAQVVFSLLVALTVLSARRQGGGSVPGWLRWLSVALVGLLFVQLVWGVLVRHLPTGLAQRMHFLSAFLIVAGVVWLVRGVFADPAARRRAGWLAVAMGGLVALQVVLGVEAWMGKFGTYVLPEMEKITPEKAAIRTAHVLIGTLLLGSAVAAALKLMSGSGIAIERSTDAPRRAATETVRELVGISRLGETT